MSHNLLSPAEHKILVGIGFLLLILLIGSISVNYIDSYNQKVALEQLSNKTGIDFSIYGMQRCLTPWETVLRLQFVWIPLIIFNVWRRKNFRFTNFLTSFCLSLINLICYSTWIYGSYISRIQNKLFEVGDDKLHTYLMIDSNLFDFSLFVGFIIFFIAQSIFLLRFASEKSQTKPLL